MNIVNLLEKAVEAHASDIFIVAGLPISYRANGSIHHENEEKLMIFPLHYQEFLVFV